MARADLIARLTRWPPWAPGGPVVPVLRLAGVIGGGGTPLRGEGLNLNAVNSSLERAFKLKGAKAVALAINSPGGSPVQSALITERIRTLAADAELPVIGFIEDVGASGGYWLALAADEIFADANSVVGSIGVIYQGFGFVEAIGRLGVERRVHTAGSEKSLLDPFRPENPKDVQKLKKLQTEIHDNFKAMVRKRRGERLAGADSELFEGQIWTGHAALEAGLIDGIGTLHTVLRERFGDDVQTPLVSRPKPWWQRRFGINGETAPRAFADALLDSVDERAIWARYGL
jgi:signal peptide peptidase SppA